jgi:hypothetical protein
MKNLIQMPISKIWTMILIFITITGLISSLVLSQAQIISNKENLICNAKEIKDIKVVQQNLIMGQAEMKIHYQYIAATLKKIDRKVSK